MCCRLAHETIHTSVVYCRPFSAFVGMTAISYGDAVLGTSITHSLTRTTRLCQTTNRKGSWNLGAGDSAPADVWPCERNWNFLLYLALPLFVALGNSREKKSLPRTKLFRSTSKYERKSLETCSRMTCIR